MPTPWMPGADFGVTPMQGAPNYSSIFSSPASAGGGGFNWGQAAGIQGLANLGMGMMGMSNTGQSLQNAYNMAGIMSDVNFGKDLWALNKDIFEQKDAPRWAAKFKMNDPFYRQYQATEAMKNPGIAGRWSTFVGQ